MENAAVSGTGKASSTALPQKVASLEFIVLSLLLAIIIAVIISAFYIYTKSSALEAVVKGLFTSVLSIAGIQNIAQHVWQWLGKSRWVKNKEDTVVNSLREHWGELWNSANLVAKVSGGIFLILSVVLPFISLPLAFDPYTQSSLQVSSISFDSWPQNAYCVPRNGSYQVNAPYLNKWDHCFSDAIDFKNFVYEARMTITNGDCGGLLFRAMEQQSDTYQFQVCQNGSYSLYYYDDKSSGPGRFTPSICTAPDGTKSSCALANNTAAAIKRGVNQSNLLAVVADGSTLTLYVNRVLLTSVEDQKFADGHIGIFATDLNGPTTVIFSDMKVWLL